MLRVWGEPFLVTHFCCEYLAWRSVLSDFLRLWVPKEKTVTLPGRLGPLLLPKCWRSKLSTVVRHIFWLCFSTLCRTSLSQVRMRATRKTNRRTLGLPLMDLGRWLGIWLGYWPKTDKMEAPAHLWVLISITSNLGFLPRYNIMPRKVPENWLLDYFKLS